MIVPRVLEPTLRTAIANNPVTAILGPYQCGKSTLAKHYPMQPSIQAVSLLELIETIPQFLSV